ncbi:MAG: hypothetical protein K8S25_05575 [Alphaproteobacteria bacterium]|nr:hypothetical protein [Alphaproteobacteria bacterium]
MSDASKKSSSDLSRLVGLMLIVIGVIWLVTTGLCSAAFAIGLADGGNSNDMIIILVVGVPSAVIGGVIYWIGRLLRPISP